MSHGAGLDHTSPIPPQLHNSAKISFLSSLNFPPQLSKPPPCPSLAQKFPPSRRSRHVSGLPGGGTDELTPLRRSEMRNGPAVTKMCQQSPGAGSCRALSRATRAVPGPGRASCQGNTTSPTSSPPLQMIFGKFFASFALHSLVLLVLGLLEMFSG